MFEGQQADLSLFLNAVGDAFVVNSSTIWNREPPKDAAGRGAIQSLGGDSRISFMDTYMITFGSDNGSAVPGFTMLEPDYGGKLEGKAQENYGLSLRKLLRDIDASQPYTPNNSGYDVSYTRTVQDRRTDNRKKQCETQGKALIKAYQEKAKALAVNDKNRNAVVDANIHGILSEFPELNGADTILQKAIEPKFDLTVGKPVIPSDITAEAISRAKTEITKVAELAEITDKRKPIADNVLMEPGNDLVLLRKTTKEGGLALDFDTLPEPFVLGSVKRMSLDSSMFYGDDSQGTIPVSQFKLADTAVNKLRYPELVKFGDDVVIWTNLSNGDFVIRTGDNVSDVYSHSTAIRRPNVMKKTGTGIVESGNPLTTYNGFVILSSEGEPVVQDDIGKVEGQVAIYAVDGMPFMHTEADENNVIRWVSDREPGKVMVVDDIQAAPIDEDVEKAIVSDDDIERLDTDTKFMEGANRENIILMELLCSPGRSIDDMTANWNEALRRLGYDPELVGGFTDKDKIGLNTAPRGGYDRLTDRNYETITTTASFDHGTGKWILPGQVVNLQTYRSRFIPTVRALAERLLYLHRLATFWGKAKDANDMPAIYEIVGGQTQYEKDKIDGANAHRNIVGEKVSLWFNQQSKKLIDAVRDHYDRKTQWLNEMLAQGKLTENDIRDHVNGVQESKKKVHIDFDGSQAGTFATAFKSAMREELSLDDNLTRDDVNKRTSKELNDMLHNLATMGKHEDSYSTTMENKVLKRFVEAYDEGGPEAAKNSLNADEYEVVKRIYLWKKNLGDYRYNSELLSSALGKLQSKEELDELEEEVVQELEDFITTTDPDETHYIEDEADQRDNTKANALSGLQRLVNGEDITNDAEVKAIQKVVTQMNAPEVTRMMQDMALTGLLGSNRRMQPLLDRQGRLEGDLLNSSEAILRLVKANAIVPLMTQTELDREWEVWTRQNYDALYAEARNLAKSITTQEEIDRYELKCSINKEPCNLDQFYMDKIKANPRLLITAGERLPGGAKKAVTKFIEEVFPRWIVENKRYRLVNPSQCRRLLNDVIDNFTNVREQIIPRNVFLSAEDRERIRQDRDAFTKGGILEDQYGRITDRVYLASTGNSDPYNRRFVNASEIVEEDIQDEDMMGDWVQNLTLQATDGTYKTIPKWVRTECDAKTKESQPDTDIIGKVVENTMVKSVLDKANDCLSAIHLRGGDSIARIMRNDPTLKQKIIEATQQAASAIADYVYGDERFEYEGGYEEQVRSDIVFDLIDSLDRTLVNRVGGNGYTEDQIKKIGDKFINIWSKQNHILPSFDTIRHDIQDTTAVSIVTGETIADDIMNKLEKAIYEQSVPMKRTIVDPETGEKRQEYITESDGVTKKLFKVKDTPKLQGLLRPHIKALRNSMRYLCVNQCQENKRTKESRTKSAVGFLG